MMTAQTHLHARFFKPTAQNINVSATSVQEKEINLKHLLLQGAKPFNQQVHDTHNNFQGAYRCEIVIVGQPSNGSVRLSEFLDGVVYFANPGFRGHDSITYKLRSSLGQDSDAKCIHIFVS